VLDYDPLRSSHNRSTTGLRKVAHGSDVGGWLQLGVNLGGIAGVLALLAGGRLVARSWADALVRQANLNAETAWKAAEAADRRADLLQNTMVEMTAAVRAVETLVRSQGMGPYREQSSTWQPIPLPPAIEGGRAPTGGTT
jgi:succinate dehydrogenase/fumarate reductase flavoprotein subunit